MSSLGSVLRTLSTLLVLLLGWLPIDRLLTLDRGIFDAAIGGTIAALSAPGEQPDDPLAAVRADGLLDDVLLDPPRQRPDRDDEPGDEPLDEPLDEPRDAPRDRADRDDEPLDSILDDAPADDEPLDLETLDGEISDEEILDDDVLDVAVLPTDDATDTRGDSAGGGGRADGGGGSRIKGGRGDPAGAAAEQTNEVEPTNEVERGQDAVMAGSGSIPAELVGCRVGAVAGRAVVGVGCGEQNVIAGHTPLAGGPVIPAGSDAAAAAVRQRADLAESRDRGGDLPALAAAGEASDDAGARPPAGSAAPDADPAAGGDVSADEALANVAPTGEPADPAIDAGSDAPPVSEPAIVGADTMNLGSLSIAPNLAGGTRYDDPVLRWLPELAAAANDTGVPIALLAAVVKVTSDGEPGLIFPDGRIGLLNVPSEAFMARGIEPALWFDPAINLRVGAELLAPIFSLAGEPKIAVLHYLAGACNPGVACAGDYVTVALDWLAYYTSALDDPRQAELAPLRRFRPAAFSPTAIGALPAPESPPAIPDSDATAGRSPRANAAAARERAQPDPVVVTPNNDDVGVDVNHPAADLAGAGAEQADGDRPGKASRRGKDDRDKR